MEKPTIIVENGTTTPGVAGALQKQFDKDGYNLSVLALTNALERNFTQTKIIDYTSGQKPNTINYLQGLLKVQAAPPDKPVKTPPADIVIILGSDYASTIQPSGTSAVKSGSTIR